MPNRSYITGRQFEFLTRSWLERNNYYVMRSAGSHSVADLSVFPLYDAKDIGLDEFNPFIIQVKGLNFSALLRDKPTLLGFLNSKELESFRELRFGSSLFKKYLFIYNTEHKSDLPLVLLHSKVGWERIDANKSILDDVFKMSGQIAGAI